MKHNRRILAMVILVIISTTGLTCADDRVSANTPLRGAKLYGDATRGKEVVERWCVNCHTMGASADDRAPSLLALAANPAKSEGYIRAFLMRPHAPMPPLNLTTQEIEDVVSYLRNLKASPQ